MRPEVNNDSWMRIARLLSDKSVQDELDLASDQATDLRAAPGEIREELAEEMEEALGDILSPKQHKLF